MSNAPHAYSYRPVITKTFEDKLSQSLTKFVTPFIHVNVSYKMKQDLIGTVTIKWKASASDCSRRAPSTWSNLITTTTAWIPSNCLSLMIVSSDMKRPQIQAGIEQPHILKLLFTAAMHYQYKWMMHCNPKLFRIKIPSTLSPGGNRPSVELPSRGPLLTDPTGISFPLLYITTKHLNRSIILYNSYTFNSRLYDCKAKINTLMDLPKV
jgi:hypothetical protein